MNAIQINGHRGPVSLEMGTAETPVVKPGEVQISVVAAGLNRADLIQSYGKYPAPPGVADIPGLEVSGTVMEVGEGVTAFAPGDRVCALLPGAGWADEVSVDAGSVMPLPAAYSWEEGAALPEAALTAFQALHLLAHMQAGEWALIHAGASGVGAMAIRMAKYGGVKVIATAGSPEKTAFCAAQGADVVVNYRTQDFLSETMAATGGKGVHVVLDFVGSAYAARNLDVLAMDGRWVLLGLLGGNLAEGFDLGKVLRKRVQLTGSTLRNRSLAYKADLVKAFWAVFGKEVEKGALKVPLFRVATPDTLVETLQLMEQNQTMGKMALRWKADA